MTMKDFILGSDEYLILSQDLLVSLVSTFQLPPPPLAYLPRAWHSPPPRATLGEGALAENVEIDERGTGHTSLHLFNDVIQQLQHLHDQIA
jgi:hypothetical protein